MQKNSANNQPSVSTLRRERERAEMTERIMDAAREMFVRDGYEAVTLRKIALAIQYSPGTIYQYFKDKRALVQTIIRKDALDLREHMINCLEGDDPVEQISELARRYALWGISHPNHYRLMNVPPPAWSEENHEVHKRENAPLEHEVLSVLTVVVTEGIRRGQLKEKYSDPALVAATLWAGIHGVVLLEISTTSKTRALAGGRDTAFADRFNTLTEVFLDGFLRGRP